MSKKISELTEAVQANNNDLIMIVQNGVNKKITADKIGTGQGGGDTLPIGIIMPYTSDTIPNGWLLCDGSPFSASEYPELFDLIGVTYGWDEDRNPLLPDMRGRVVVGKKAATSVNDTEFNALGKTGGEKAHTLTKSELPQIDIQTNYASSSGGDGSGLVYGTKTGSSNNSLIENINYGGEAHNNLQPYIVTNFIIKAKMTVAIEGEIIQENDTATTENVYSASAVDNKLAQIIQSGSNTNGSYIKYSDGTMICYGSTSLNEVSVSDYYSFCKRTNSLTITFPMEFDEVPNVTITNQGFGIFSYTINNITANNFSYYAFTYPSGSNISGSLQYVAIGRWK